MKSANLDLGMTPMKTNITQVGGINPTSFGRITTTLPVHKTIYHPTKIKCQPLRITWILSFEWVEIIKYKLIKCWVFGGINESGECASRENCWALGK